MIRRLGAVVVGAVLLAGCTSAEPRDASGRVTAPVSVDTFSIRVGDCVRTLETDATSRLDLVPCDQPHAWEAFSGGTATGDAFPGNSGLKQQADELCSPAFQTFVGVSPKDSKYEVRFLTPTKDTWAQGDRAVTCLVGSPSGGLTGSLAGVAK